MLSMSVMLCFRRQVNYYCCLNNIEDNTISFLRCQASVGFVITPYIQPSNDNSVPNMRYSTEREGQSEPSVFERVYKG
jgi:hypothetical protein